MPIEAAGLCRRALHCLFLGAINEQLETINKPDTSYCTSHPPFVRVAQASECLGMALTQIETKDRIEIEQTHEVVQYFFFQNSVCETLLPRCDVILSVRCFLYFSKILKW